MLVIHVSILEGLKTNVLQLLHLYKYVCIFSFISGKFPEKVT